MSNPVSSSDISSEISAGFAACSNSLCQPVLILILCLQMYVLYRGALFLLAFFTGVVLLLVFFLVVNFPVSLKVHGIIRCLGETACAANGFKKVVFYIQIMRRCKALICFKFLHVFDGFGHPASMCIGL